MDEIPEYLRRASAVAAAGLARFAAEDSDDSDVVVTVAEVAEDLAAWAADEDFWKSAWDGFESELPVDLDEGVVRDEELALLTAALDGNRPLAWMITIELRFEDLRGDPESARQVVGDAAASGRELVQQKPGRSRTWRAVRFLRRTLSIVGGGLAIAADVVSPDATGITKVASIVGGVSAIVGSGG